MAPVQHVALDTMVDILKAAAESSRLRILVLLSRGDLTVSDLTDILSQSQPRVSRHLKLLAEAGLVERFPDGAWVFYRLTADGQAAELVAETLARVDPADPVLARDAEQLSEVRAERTAAAADYFARNAARWDEIRSLYVAEADVEQAILDAAGPGPFRRLVDLGTGAGFPGIPLKIRYPRVSLILVETHARRVAFLEDACAALGLRDTKVIKLKATSESLREPAAGVITRAFERIAATVKPRARSSSSS